MPRKAKPAAETEEKHVSAPSAENPPADAAVEGLPPGVDQLNSSLNEKIRHLIRLSKEQGYLTHSDINDALPEGLDNPEEIDNVLSILQNLEIDILDPDEVDSYKQRQEEQEEEETRSSQHDILDDPVRMYLKQMGQVPLLTREQEVEISKRIENAELQAQEALFQVGIISQFLIVLGQKLLTREERFDRVVIDKKIDSREAYFKGLPKLVETTEKGEKTVAEGWEEYTKARSEAERKKVMAKFKKRETLLRSNFSKFYFKLKVYEEFLEGKSPLLAEIQKLYDDLDRAKHPKTKKDAAIDSKGINQRLKQIEVEYRIPPPALMEAVRKSREHMREAHQAKTEMVEANLRLVISIAQTYPNRA